MAKEFELVRKIAVLGGREGGTTKEINIVRWGQFGQQIDIRRWKAGEPGKGDHAQRGGGPKAAADAVTGIPGRQRRQSVKKDD